MNSFIIHKYLKMEELNELKNMVMQNLEKNGYLSNIRAQIRSSVFKTIDMQESSGTKPSPFYSENAKVQKLSEDSKGLNCLMLIKDLLQTYEMQNTLPVFSSESNQKNPPKREVLALKNNVQQAENEPLLYGIFQKYMKNAKVPKGPAKEKQEKKEVVFPANENESEGEVEEVEEEIVRNNESRRFGESEQFGQSQGYDVTVDSLKLEEYDYYQDIN